MKTVGLTKKQSEMLSYIAQFTADKGFSPSYQEIMEFMGYASKSRVHVITTDLIKRGYLKRVPNAVRSLQVCGENRLEAAWNAATADQRLAFEQKYFPHHSLSEAA